MGLEKIGLRRLYDSRACDVDQHDEILLEFSIDKERHGQLYLGRKPKFGIWIEDGPTDRFMSGDMKLLMSGKFTIDPTGTLYEGRFFTEIACFVDVEVDDETSKLFHAKEQTGHQELLKLVEERRTLLREGLDLVAGILGMRAHPQFVTIPILENAVAIRGIDSFAHDFASTSVRVLRDLSLNEGGQANIEAILTGLASTSDEAKRAASRSSYWLLRAWSEFDDVSEFLSLFIPIELALQSVEPAQSEERENHIKRIRDLIKSHGGSDREQLDSVLDSLTQNDRPSLAERFRSMAQEAALQGWEGDVKAFKRFNRMRNDLLHRGDSSVRLLTGVQEEDVRRLEHLTARYVNYVQFRDDRSYIHARQSSES